MQQLAHSLLRRALGQAVKWGTIPRNVCEAVEKPRAPKKPIKVLNKDQVDSLLTVAQEDRLYALYVLAVTTGLRQGELLALQWEDVDLDSDALSVRHTLLEMDGKLELVEPKTAMACRKVDLPQMAVKALRRHRKQMLAEGHIGSCVFCDTKGGPIRKSNLIRRSFKPLLKNAGLPDIRFHDLRHTAATLLLVQGVNPKVVQERLGHAQISLTLDTYSHVLPSIQKEAASKLDSLFAKPNS